ncbi:hypothetical protein HK097_004334 [Rhizophlyctis rosea]|uniref:tRNA(Phe) (4-demethylwyosine(37)-C(7)) aminocarboxypropyltransferase n=1 Tax=Rhizophlyctis rosea TaxID=64517 RepID=A0AAD5SMA7_9FUNG|nr:hypothetical protein HK097_004334 [Rhizophlyctis rosea]
MMVHAEGDTVSSEVMKTGIWEKENTRQILAGLSLVSEVRGREAAGFIDIGANVGWFSLMVARRGYKVSAVEPSPRNQLCIRHSTCLNADLGKQIILYDMGMAEDPDVCHLYTQDGNNGNAMLECGKTENETPKPSIFNDGPYWYQATVKVSTLDDTFGKKGDNSVGTYGIFSAFSKD